MFLDPQVAVVPCDHPALRHLRDAVALTKDSSVPGELASRLVPGLCRLALDAACIDRIRATRLGAGADHVDVERLIEDQPKLYPRMALALFDDEKRTGDVLARLKSAYGTWAVAAFKGCNSGAHAVSSGDLTELLNNTRTLVQRLQQ